MTDQTIQFNKDELVKALKSIKGYELNVSKSKVVMYSYENKYLWLHNGSTNDGVYVALKNTECEYSFALMVEKVDLINAVENIIYNVGYLDINDNSITVRDESGQAFVVVSEEIDFKPELEHMPNDVVYTGKKLNIPSPTIIAKMANFVSLDENRGGLCNIRYEEIEKSASFIATNGYKLAIYNTIYKINCVEYLEKYVSVSPDYSCNIPINNNIVSLINNYKGLKFIALNNDDMISYILENDNLFVLSNTFIMNSDYSDYRNTLRKEQGNSYRISSSKKLTSYLSRFKKATKAVFNPELNSLDLYEHDEIIAQRLLYNNKSLTEKVSVNPSYLKECLDYIADDYFILDILNCSKAIYLFHNDYRNKLVMLTPIRE